MIQIDTCMQIKQTKSNDNRDGCTLFNSLSPIRVYRVVLDNRTVMKSFSQPIEINTNSCFSYPQDHCRIQTKSTGSFSQIDITILNITNDPCY
jgi:hypothetical protein